MKNINGTAFLHGMLGFSWLAIGIANSAPGHLLLAAVFLVLSVLFLCAPKAVSDVT